jgi:hypothetical protein
MSLFGLLSRSDEDEILDLTAPALEGEGIVARWLRESLARSAEPTYLPVHRAAERTA